jgi:aminoglycoside phosphotransferase (APT) family kinase protein
MNPKPTVAPALAGDILESHFGKRPAKVKRLHGGLVNDVFEAKIGRDEFVVRISRRVENLQTFMKEQWAVRQARALKIPAPEILEVGHAGNNAPYMISLKVVGCDATHWPDRHSVARLMGELAARINSIHTAGFGSVFDWSPNELSRHATWKLYLDRELNLPERVELLAAYRMVTPVCLRRLKAQVKHLRAWPGPPHLNHGDIRFKNVVLDDAGKIRALLDWENCTSNRAPHWELSIALHDLNLDEKEAFLEGYGMTAKDFSRIAPDLKALNILNYASAVRHAARKNDKARLAFLRARLHGAFDLHSL